MYKMHHHLIHLQAGIGMQHLLRHIQQVPKVMEAGSPQPMYFLNNPHVSYHFWYIIDLQKHAN